MATLVLTTVGGAIGGPIGAALGAVVGNQIDRAVLLPGRARTGPRLTDLAVQTSRYGEQIARVYGTMRVAGSVTWSTDLIETRSTSRSGKGQPSTATYSYAASFAVALSARRAGAVGRIWADGKLLRGAAGDWKSRVGAFRFHPGDERQMPDPLIASAVGAAPAHRGIAYVVFEELQLADFGNRIPSLTFELIADATPVAAAGIARELGREARVGADAATVVDGFAASGSSVAGALATLAQVCDATIVPDGAGGLMMTGAAKVPIALDEDVEVTWTRAPADGVPRTLAVSHYEPARDYQLGVQTARRPGAGWRDETLEAPAVMTAGAARALAERVLARAEAEAEHARVVAGVTSLAIAPGNTVTLPGDPRLWRVTRTQLEEHAVTLDLLPWPAGIATDVPTDAGAPPPVTDVPAGETLIAAFELPSLTDELPTVPQLLIAASGTAAGWRGAALAVSGDGAAWTPAGASATPAAMGTLATALPGTSAMLEDRANTIEVTLAHAEMTLLSRDKAARDRGANLALIGDELVQFGGAEQLDDVRWRLSSLWRGRRATDVTTHDAGTRFVLIEADALVAVALPASAPGDSVQVVASAIADTARTSAMLTGASLAPPPPAHLRATPIAGGDVQIDWVRRSRLGWRWQDGVDAPLVEEREAYRVTVQAADGATSAHLVDTPGFTLPAATRHGGAVAVAVCQLGTRAPSRAARITIEGV